MRRNPMDGNKCPKCGNAVMTYGRFFREAEPYKKAGCGSCGIQLRRDPKVYFFLLPMIVVLWILCWYLVTSLTDTGTVLWIILPLLVILLALWAVVTNYISWRYIGWIVADEDKKTPQTDV